MKLYFYFKNLDRYIESWFSLQNEDKQFPANLRKYILDEIRYFENANYFSMSHLHDDAYETRSFPSPG